LYIQNNNDLCIDTEYIFQNVNKFLDKSTKKC